MQTADIAHMTPEDVSQPEQYQIRENILRDISDFKMYGIKDQVTIIQAELGKAILWAGNGIVWIDWIPTDLMLRQRFWMNKSSLENLSTSLKLNSHRRRAFNFFKLVG